MTVLLEYVTPRTEVEWLALWYLAGVVVVMPIGVFVCALRDELEEIVPWMGVAVLWPLLAVLAPFYGLGVLARKFREGSW